MQKPPDIITHGTPVIDCGNSLYTAALHDLCIQRIGNRDGVYVRCAAKDAALVFHAHEYSPIGVPVVIDGLMPEGVLEFKHAKGGPPLMRVKNIGGLQTRKTGQTIPGEVNVNTDQHQVHLEATGMAE